MSTNLSIPTPPALALAASCFLGSCLQAAENHRQHQPDSPFPPQLEIMVPYEPTVFRSDGRQRLVYELVLRNFERAALDLQQLAVLDADDHSAAPLAVFDTAQLQTLIRPIGLRPSEADAGATLASGSSVMVYLLLSLDADAQVPAYLRHRLRTSAGELEAGPISTQHDSLQVLGPPVTGNGWLAETGLSNDNGHRRGNILLDGRSVISRRYAFDWIQVEKGARYAGDEQANAAYFGYGEAVVAVADAAVAGAIDYIPENIPGSRPAGSITQDTITGNRVTLDLGQGHYAHYMHLQPGSIRVKAGDRVQRGQVLGLIGNSGDSFGPHLHFEITNSARTLAGEGIPYVIETFLVPDEEHGTATRHREELPLEKMVVDFGG